MSIKLTKEALREALREIIVEETWELDGEGREALREEIARARARAFRAFDDQRDWVDFVSSKNRFKVILPSGVRSMIPYKGRLLVATGYGGGIFSLPDGANLYQYPVSETGQNPQAWVCQYVPGNQLDRVVFSGSGAIYYVTPDLSVSRYSFIEAGESNIDVMGFASSEYDSEDLYVKLHGGALYRVDFRNLTSVKLVDRPVSGMNMGGRGMAFYGDDLYAPAENAGATIRGIWRYSAGAWTRIKDDIRYRQLNRGWVYYHLLGEDTVRRFITVTNDFATFEDNIAPRTGTMGHTSSPSITGNVSLVVYQGVLWNVRDKTCITALRSLEVNAQELEWWQGNLVIGYNAPNSMLERDMAEGALDFIYSSQLIGPLGPARAEIWDAEAIENDEQSYPILTSGWNRFTLFFISNQVGNLIIQFDLLGDGDWRQYNTTAIGANTASFQVIDADPSRIRLEYDTASTVSAKIALQRTPA